MGAGDDAVARADAGRATTRWHTAAYLGIAAVLATTSAAQGWSRPWAPVTLVVLLPLGAWGILTRTRRPWLLPLAGILDTLAGFDIFLGLGVFALMLRRRRRLTVTLIVLGAAAVTVSALATPAPDAAPRGTSAAALAGLTWAGTMLVQVVVPVLVGGWIGTQRELVGSLRARALAAEATRRLRDREAVLQERERIAQEMHDSLGHQLALVAMHAGALTVNAGAGPQAVGSQAELIRATARQALVDLRRVVGALRTSEPARMPPATGMAAVHRLVAQSAQVAQVRFEEALPPGRELPEPTGRAVVRIVQEGLTNAHRHAPAAPIEVCVRGAPGAGVDVTLVNRLTPEPMPAGNGIGLAALAERVRVLGGSLAAGADDDHFRLAAHLPWPEHEDERP